jgi:hypothetical protein
LRVRREKAPSTPLTAEDTTAHEMDYESNSAAANDGREESAPMSHSNPSEESFGSKHLIAAEDGEERMMVGNDQSQLKI